MTCKVCNHINELSAVRCINCGYLLGDVSIKTKEKEIKAEEKISPLDTAIKDIKNAWMAGVVSGVLTLGITLIAMSGVKILSYGAFELIDVALVFGLTFGIYKKSRVCAVLMLIYFLFSKFMLFQESGKFSGIPLILVFIYYYYKGILGTFNYHKLVGKNKNA
jgi:hypothetical protein